MLMIADCDTNVVFVADCLPIKFPQIYHGLRSILTEHGVPLELIPGTRDIWCRDYMPIQVAEDRFVQFRYAPDYLSGKYRHLRADGEIGPTLPWIKECVRSEIVLDGGNVVKWTDKVIMTEKVLDENPGSGRKLKAELERLLEADRVILIPPEPGDVTGHADGIVRFVDDNSVVVNDYRRIEPDYRGQLLTRLRRAGLKVVEISFTPKLTSRKGMPSAVGNHLNFLQVKDVLIVPTYTAVDSHQIESALRAAYPESRLTFLYCRNLAEEGGALNCCSYSISLTGPKNLGGTAAFNCLIDT
jgi:agmatine/peptidylarginine deiminase